jgi:hypothetical protein
MTHEDTAPGRSRTAWLGLLALAVVAAVVAGLIAVLGPADADDDAAAGGTPPPTSPSTSAAAGAPEQPPATASAPPAVASQVEGVPPALEPVGLGDAVVAAPGITAEVSSVSALQASATGPGNVAGPALAVTVRITNGSDAPVELDELEVSLSYTAEEWSASPVNDGAVSPLRGMLAAGRTAEGTYVFSVPSDQRDVVTVTVGLAAGAPLLVFTGPAD